MNLLVPTHPEMHADEMYSMNCIIEITRCPPTLTHAKTQTILSNMKSCESDKKVSYIKDPNAGLGAFLDITVGRCRGGGGVVEYGYFWKLYTIKMDT